MPRVQPSPCSRREATEMSRLTLCLAAVVSLAFAGSARAQATLHHFDASVKVSFQEMNDANDQKIGHDQANSKDVFELCTEMDAEKGQSLGIIINCGGENDQSI